MAGQTRCPLSLCSLLPYLSNPYSELFFLIRRVSVLSFLPSVCICIQAPILVSNYRPLLFDTVYSIALFDVQPISRTLKHGQHTHTCVHTHTHLTLQREKRKRPGQIRWEVPVHSKVFCFSFDLLFLETCPLTLSRNISIRLPRKPRARTPKESLKKKQQKRKEHKAFYTYAALAAFIYLYTQTFHIFYRLYLPGRLYFLYLIFPYFLFLHETYGAAAAVSSAKDDQKRTPFEKSLTRATRLERCWWYFINTQLYSGGKGSGKDIVLNLSIAPIGLYTCV